MPFVEFHDGYHFNLIESDDRATSSSTLSIRSLSRSHRFRCGLPQNRYTATIQSEPRFSHYDTEKQKFVHLCDGVYQN